MTDMNQKLVVNWHITEACNYNCEGCYSKWNHQNEVWNDPRNVRMVIENIAKFHAEKFGPAAAPWRLSVVGGEPILFKDKAQMTVETAYRNGAEVSVITNGSHLENIFPYARMISQVGISIDSFNHVTNMNVGRQHGGKTLSFEDVSRKLNALREINPDVRIKINSVVNRNNYAETLVDKVAALGVSKYKILRQLPFGGCKGVTDEQFYTFIRNNYREDLFGDDYQHIFIEDNSVMTGSYLMISPCGSLFQNGQEKYQYSTPLMDTPFEEALKQIHFSQEKFCSRYSNVATDAVLLNMEKKLAS